MTEAPSRTAPSLFAAQSLPQRRLAVAGAAMLLLGILAPVFPTLLSVAAGVAAGWLLWFAGAVMLGLSLLILPSWLRLGGVVASFFAVGAGMLLTFRPTTGALALAVLLAAVFVVDGSFQVALALKLRPVRAWRWVLASAFASLIAAALTAGGALEGAPPDVGTVIALAFVTTGLGLLAVAAARPTGGPQAHGRVARPS